MSGSRLKRLAITAVGAAVWLLSATSAPAWGAAGDPLFVYSPTGATPPPTGRLSGPCGVAVQSNGSFYVSDYYHHVVDQFGFSPSPAGTFKIVYLGQSSPVSGPCALAFDSSGALYVNDFHQSVAKQGVVFDSAHPTGVAVDTSNNHVFVNDRTYIAVYDASGSPVEDGGEPLRIGLGTIEDGYGVAVSQFPATAGYVYVPDAATDTVKVFNSASDKVNPIATIDGPGSGFSSLRNAAVAVDRVSGNVYVTDNLQPLFTEEPEAVVRVFDSTGAYLGRLKFNVIDALPVGLAVDNSATPSQGRVYVTSGNTVEAVVYAYAPGSQVASGGFAATQSLRVASSGPGQVVTAAAGGMECSASCELSPLAGSQVTLSAVPSPGASFAGFSGGGCADADECTVSMDEARLVNAGFTAPSEPSAEVGPPPSAEPSSDPPSAPPSATRPKRLTARFHGKKHRHHARRHRQYHHSRGSDR